MSWRDRYPRDRRDGLAPLPADATPAQREARIAELRMLRQRRRRKRARRAGLVILLAGAATMALAYWLVATLGGRDFLLGQIATRLPAGAVLTWTRAEGPVAGPLVLHDVHVSLPRQRDPDCVPTPQARCAMGTITFDARTVVLDPALRPLLGRTLRLDALDIRDATLDLPRSDAPFELPRWPDVLPDIEPPLDLRADAIRIDGLRVLQEGRSMIDIRRARGGLEARRGALHVERLTVDSDRGRFTLHGDYAPRRDFRSDLVATAVLPAPLGTTAPRLGLVARGDLSRMVVGIGGRVPAPLRATLVLQGDPAAPRWQLDARSDALDPALLAGSPPGEPLQLALAARGIGGGAHLQGTLRRGALAIRLQPSTLRLQDQQLQLQPLVVDVLDGRITANGSADLRDPANTALKLAVNARRLRWTSADGATTLTGDADLGVAGRLERWAVKGQARLQRGDERATVDLTGLGNRDALRIDALKATMPQGRLEGRGEIAWAPRLSWTATTTLAGFDPGYVAPDWPGAVNGRLHTTGTLRDDGRLRADLDARDLGGTLRGRALAGRGAIQMDGDDYSGELALSLGASRIDVRGKFAAAIEVDARFAPLRLDDLLPGGRGIVRGTLQLHGARAAPDVDADLDGRDIALGTYRAQRFTAKGRLPWRTGNGALTVDARGLHLGVPLVTLHAGLQGAVERLRFEVTAGSDTATLALAGNARKQGAHWQGTLARLLLHRAPGTAWTLQQPAAWRWEGQRGVLSPLCLGAAAGGVLCAQGGWPQRGLELRGDALPLALAADWLPTRSDGQRWAFDGTVDLEARIRPAGGAWQATVLATSTSGGVRVRPRARRNLVGYRDLRLDAQLDPRRIKVSLGAGLDRDGRLDARVTTGYDAHAPLSGTLVAGTGALTWLELFSPDLVEPGGRLDVDLHVGGTLGQPRLGGSARLQQFSAELPALGIALQDGDIGLQALEDGSARIQGRLGTGQGVLQVDGRLGWQDDTTPLQLTLRGRDVLLADTRQVRLLASPEVTVRYRAGAPLEVRGAVAVPEADLHLERLDTGVSPSPDVVVLDPADPRKAAAVSLAPDLDITLEVGQHVRIDGYGLTGTLAGRLHLRQPSGQDMRASGVLDVAGRYRAYGQDLRITLGRLLWSNSVIGDPLLDIRAQREIGEVTAGMQVSGRASAPQVSVWSNPAMSQSEALAYLTLGRPLPSLSSRELQQVDVAKSALNTGVGLLTARLGARIGLDDAGVSTSRALGGEVLGIGKYLSPKLYVSYGVSLLGTGQVVTLKYLLRKGFDLQVESSTVENRASVNWRTEK